jgi:hypothetical protein
MEAFLEFVASAAYGPIVGKIEGYIKKKLEEYDEFIRGKSDLLKILVWEDREADPRSYPGVFRETGDGVEGQNAVFQPFRFLLPLPVCFYSYLASSHASM